MDAGRAFTSIRGCLADPVEPERPQSWLSQDCNPGSRSGALMYDSNGNAAGGVTLLAILANKPVDVAANDFAVI
jgi:hypothetical protein